MKKNYYLVGMCAYCGGEVWSNHLAKIPGVCLHKKCLENYRNMSTHEL